MCKKAHYFSGGMNCTVNIHIFLKINKDKSDDLKTKIAELIKLCKEKISSGIDRELLYSVISEYNGGKRNPNTITDSDVADQIVAEIKEKWHE